MLTALTGLNCKENFGLHMWRHMASVERWV